MIEISEIRSSGIFDYEIFQKADEVTFSSFGENRRGLLVAIAGDEAPVLKSFLEKILQAVQYSLDEDALTIWVTPSMRFCFSDIASRERISHAIFFGLEPAGAGLNFDVSLYKPLMVGQKVFLFCDDLTSIQSNQSLKRLLWESLKTIFLGEQND